jgi:hypothetical protein
MRTLLPKNFSTGVHPCSKTWGGWHGQAFSLPRIVMNAIRGLVVEVDFDELVDELVVVKDDFLLAQMRHFSAIKNTTPTVLSSPASSFQSYAPARSLTTPQTLPIPHRLHLKPPSKVVL